MTTNKPTTHTTALWLGDLHLDRASKRKRNMLLDRLSNIESDCVVVSGDISSSKHLREHLLQLASACAPRDVYFCPGNHDFHGSGISEVEADLASLCASVENLHHLNCKRIISLGDGIGLVGHHGWADARAGYGQDTVIDCPDRNAIREFRGLTQKESLRKMTALGKESAGMIRKTLPLALTRFQHVVILTHVPPFSSAVKHDGNRCGLTHLPHFTNLSAGMAILGIARAFPRRRITVLAGHTHSGCVTTIAPNLSIRVGHARTGNPGIFDVIKF